MARETADKRAPRPRTVAADDRGILMLVVLAMLIVRAGDPTTWRWLATDKPVEPPTPVPVTVAPPTGPTDEDLRRRLRPAKSFRRSRTVAWSSAPRRCRRTTGWSSRVKNQSFARLWQRATKGLAYTYLYDEANKQRGKLVALDVEVRLVRDADKNRDGVHVCEAWAATDESRGRLYDLIVVDLPKTGSGRRLYPRTGPLRRLLSQASGIRAGHRKTRPATREGAVAESAGCNGRRRPPRWSTTRRGRLGGAVSVVVAVVLVVRFVSSGETCPPDNSSKRCHVILRRSDPHRRLAGKSEHGR